MSVPNSFVTFSYEQNLQSLGVTKKVNYFFSVT